VHNCFLQRASRVLDVEMVSVPKLFSRRTLEKFEDASASIPLRQIDRTFQASNIPLAADLGGPGGSRRTQFRRYVASVDQHDPQQLDRLCAALAALIAEVAASKVDFLVNSAEIDGFFYTDGVFRQAGTFARSFVVTSVEDLASIDELGKRLRLLADDTPQEAIGGATELVDSVCRTVLRLLGKPAPRKPTDLRGIAELTLKTLEPGAAGLDDAQKSADLVHTSLRQLGAVVASLGDLRNVYGSGHGGEGGQRKDLSPRHARLAVGAAITIAGFIAETYVEQAAKK
jgi:hypothetical protein